MNRHLSDTEGFTMIEVLVAIAIVLIIGSMGVWTYYSQRSASKVKAAVEGVGAVLSRAKADALGGKSASSFGVYFASSSYTYFIGTTYNASDPNNLVSNVPDGLVLNDTFPNNQVVFAHLTGFPSAAGTTTVSDPSNASSTKTVYTGTAGDITVVQ